MNDFFNAFISDIRYPKTPKVFTEYVAKKRSKYHVFVEGHSDEKFYSTFIYKKINSKIFPGDVAYIKCNGKKGVFEICDYLLKKFNAIKNDKSKIFIVDRDYDGVLKCSEETKGRITMTKYYSFENYAFVPENLEVLLDEVVSKNNKQLFKNLIDDFIEQISTYEAIQSLNVRQIIFKPINKKIEDYNVSIINNKFVIDNSFNDEVLKLVDSFSEKEKKALVNEKEKLNKPIYMRGHDLQLAFDLISKEIGNEKKLIDLLSNYKFVEKMNIVIDIK